MGLCFAKRSLEGWGSEEKNFFSEIHHPSNDLEAKQNTSLNSPETQIFEAFVCFYIANLPCFSIFCYLTKLIFFPFC